MKKYKFIIIILIFVIILAISLIIYFFNKSNEMNMVEAKKFNELESNKIDSEENINNKIQNQGSKTMNYQNEDIKINVIINNKKFSATLNNNDTVKQLVEKFPITLNMSELNANEKYNYLDFNLITNYYTPNNINAGDIKLYGSNCLVIFFKSFSNSYSYTDIGKIDNVSSFVSELNKGNITMSFEIEDI